jgi:excisionase family DNA binding protein
LASRLPPRRPRRGKAGGRVAPVLRPSQPRFPRAHKPRQQKTKKPGVTGPSVILNLERETGFEPATLSLGTVFTESPTTCKDVQAFAIPTDPVSDAVQRSRENPLLFEDFATPVLRRKLTVGTTPEGFLTVREAARRLKVSTATVYKACARGEMPCVRVLNVLRIPEGGLGGGRSSCRTVETPRHRHVPRDG